MHKEKKSKIPVNLKKKVEEGSKCLFEVVNTRSLISC